MSGNANLYRFSLVLLQCRLLALYLQIHRYVQHCTIHPHFFRVLSVKALIQVAKFIVETSCTQLVPFRVHPEMDHRCKPLEDCNMWLFLKFWSPAAHLILLSVLNRIHCGIGLFCLAFFASFCFILKVFWEGCTETQLSGRSLSGPSCASCVSSWFMTFQAMALSTEVTLAGLESRGLPVHGLGPRNTGAIPRVRRRRSYHLREVGHPTDTIFPKGEG